MNFTSALQSLAGELPCYNGWGAHPIPIVLTSFCLGLCWQKLFALRFAVEDPSDSNDSYPLSVLLTTVVSVLFGQRLSHSNGSSFCLASCSYQPCKVCPGRGIHSNDSYSILPHAHNSHCRLRCSGPLRGPKAKQHTRPYTQAKAKEQSTKLIIVQTEERNKATKELQQRGWTGNA